MQDVFNFCRVADCIETRGSHFQRGTEPRLPNHCTGTSKDSLYVTMPPASELELVASGRKKINNLSLAPQNFPDPDLFSLQ